MKLACGIVLYEVRHLPSASRNLLSESVLTRGMGMSISKVGESDAVIGRLQCPAVEVIVPWVDGLYVFTDEDSMAVSPKVINSLKPISNIFRSSLTPSTIPNVKQVLGSLCEKSSVETCEPVEQYDTKWGDLICSVCGTYTMSSDDVSRAREVFDVVHDCWAHLPAPRLKEI